MDRHLFPNLIEAGNAEILAFQQVVSTASNQFAYRRDSQTDHTLFEHEPESPRSETGSRKQSLFLGTERSGIEKSST